MRFQEQTFEDARINLDDNELIGCTLNHCQVVYKATGPTVLRMNNFHDPHWSFEGPAAQMLVFLRVLYHGGGQGTVEQIIAKIREPMSDDDQLKGIVA